ncbi:MAG TPA: ribulose-phosphate 3-epimerase [Candidatus Paceibacterota bacterium]
MFVIPAINCGDYKTAEEQIKTAVSFIGQGGWIHIDIVDGKFAPNFTWGTPEELGRIIRDNSLFDINFEIHLMVKNPHDFAEDWFRVGAKRLIVHLETLENLQSVIDSAKKHNGELMLAIDQDVKIDDAVPFLDKFDYFQILAVRPGLAGQKFIPDSLYRIKFLRQRAPNVKIEVDGGINSETARLCKEVGADIVVSASFIFESGNPEQAYKELLAT